MGCCTGLFGGALCAFEQADAREGVGMTRPTIPSRWVDFDRVFGLSTAHDRLDCDKHFVVLEMELAMLYT